MLIRLPSFLLWPLFWLALLVLPAGAQAAAAVAPCHQAQVQVRTAAPQQDAAAAQVAGAADRQPCASEQPGCGHAGKLDHGRCGNCPACCAGVALASAPLPALPAAGPAFVAIPFSAGHLPSVDPTLPERPPRQLFA